MVNPIEQARKRARTQIQSLYDGLCDAYHFTEKYDAAQHRNRVTKEVLYREMPCRVSISSSSPSASTDTVAKVIQTITLYCEPEKVIPPGCTVEVTQAGRTTRYESSGEPRVYPTHQEIGLTLTEDKA